MTPHQKHSRHTHHKNDQRRMNTQLPPVREPPADVIADFARQTAIKAPVWHDTPRVRAERSLGQRLFQTGASVTEPWRGCARKW